MGEGGAVIYLSVRSSPRESNFIGKVRSGGVRRRRNRPWKASHGAPSLLGRRGLRRAEIDQPLEAVDLIHHHVEAIV